MGEHSRNPFSLPIFAESNGCISDFSVFRLRFETAFPQDPFLRVWYWTIWYHDFKHGSQTPDVLDLDGFHAGDFFRLFGVAGRLGGRWWRRRPWERWDWRGLRWWAFNRR